LGPRVSFWATAAAAPQTPQPEPTDPTPEPTP